MKQMNLSAAEKRLLKATDEQLARLEQKYPEGVQRARLNRLLMDASSKDQALSQAKEMILAQPAPRKLVLNVKGKTNTG